MSFHISDWKWACIAAVFLLGTALFIIFVIHPGGFEGQVGWFILLLPGSLPASLLSDLIYKLAPSLDRVVYWALIIIFNYGWYWGISYAIVKIFRVFGPKGWEGF